jgi:hypothetical protein
VNKEICEMNDQAIERSSNYDPAMRHNSSFSTKKGSHKICGYLCVKLVFKRCKAAFLGAFVGVPKN